MLPTGNLLVLCVLAGSSYAVFYTKSSDNEYPRIGRRAFYTSGNGYPRIGRRDSSGSGVEIGGKSLPGSSAGFPDVREAFEKRGLYTSGSGYPRIGRRDSSGSGGEIGGKSSTGFHELREAFEKRGLYTSAGGYPRVGRSGANSKGAIWQHMRANLLRNMAALEPEEEAEDDLASEDRKDDSGSGYGLELMFMAFDQNDDNQLSKEEFTEGMTKYRQQNPLC